MVLVNGIENGPINAFDRGLAYGDGVFRTMVMRDATPVLWGRQYAKLAEDCAALGIDCPAIQLLQHDLTQISARKPDCIVKIIVTRGCSERGYAIPGNVSPTRIVSGNPLPEYPAGNYRRGIRVFLCRQRIAVQPRLAGVKHLNRLENVLARSEWNDPDICEGLLCDTEENIVGGTMTNLFLVTNGILVTPDLRRCGVAGLTRDIVMEMASENSLAVRINSVSIDDLLGASEVFIVNSVIGIWPVVALAQKSWDSGQITARVRKWLVDAQNA